MKSSQSDFLVSVEGLPGLFSVLSGRRTTADSRKEYDGGKRDPEVLTGRASTENLRVGRAYDAAIDADVISFLRPRVGRWRTTVSERPTDADLNAVSRPTVYPQAVLVAVSPPDVDSNSAETARYEFEFAVGSVA